MKSHHKLVPRRSRAFTIIEVIVVISTLAFVLPIVTIMLFIILRQQLTVARMTEVKRQGDQAISFMQSKLNTQAEHMFDITNIRICEAQTTDPKTISFFKDTRDITTIEFTLKDGILNFNGEPLTNSKVKVLADSLKIECIRSNSFTHPIVGIDFSMVAGGNISESEKISTKLHFSTKVVIRNK